MQAEIKPLEVVQTGEILQLVVGIQAIAYKELYPEAGKVLPGESVK